MPENDIELHDVLNQSTKTGLIPRKVSGRQKAKKLADEDVHLEGSGYSQYWNLYDLQNNYEPWMQIDPQSYYIDSDGEERVRVYSPYVSQRKVTYEGGKANGFTDKKQARLDKKMQDIYDRRYLANAEDLINRQRYNEHKQQLRDTIKKGGKEAEKAMEQTVTEGINEAGQTAWNIATFLPGPIGDATRVVIGGTMAARGITAGRTPWGEFKPKNIRYGDVAMGTALAVGGASGLWKGINPEPLMEYGVDYVYDPTRTYTAEELTKIWSGEQAAHRTLQKMGIIGKDLATGQETRPLRVSEKILKNGNIDWNTKGGYKIYKKIYNAFESTPEGKAVLHSRFTEVPKTYKQYKARFNSGFDIKSDLPPEDQNFGYGGGSASTALTVTEQGKPIQNTGRVYQRTPGIFTPDIDFTEPRPMSLPVSDIEATYSPLSIKFANAANGVADKLNSTVQNLKTADVGQAVKTVARRATKLVPRTIKYVQARPRLQKTYNDVEKYINNLSSNKQSYENRKSEIVNKYSDILKRYDERLWKSLPYDSTLEERNAIQGLINKNYAAAYDIRMGHAGITDRQLGPRMSRIVSLPIAKMHYSDIENFIKKHPYDQDIDKELEELSRIDGDRIGVKVTTGGVKVAFSPGEREMPIFGTGTDSGPIQTKKFTVNYSNPNNTPFNRDLIVPAKDLTQVSAASLRSATSYDPAKLNLVVDPIMEELKQHNIIYVESRTGGVPGGTAVFTGIPFNDIDFYTTQNIIRKKFSPTLANKFLTILNNQLNDFGKRGFTKINYQLDPGPDGKSIYGKDGLIHMNVLMADPKTGRAIGANSIEWFSQADPEGYSKACLENWMNGGPDTEVKISYTPDQLLSMLKPTTKAFIDSLIADFIPEFLAPGEEKKVKYAGRIYGYMAYGNTNEIRDGITGAYKYFAGNDYQMAPRFAFTDQAANYELLKKYGFPYDISDDPVRMQQFFDFVVLDKTKWYRGIGNTSYGESQEIYDRDFVGPWSGGVGGSANGWGNNAADASSEGRTEQRKFAMKGQILFTDAMNNAKTPEEFIAAMDRANGDHYIFTDADIAKVNSLPSKMLTYKDSSRQVYDLTKNFRVGLSTEQLLDETRTSNNYPQQGDYKDRQAYWSKMSDILRNLEIWTLCGDRYHNTNGPIYKTLIDDIPGPKLYTEPLHHRSMVQRTKYLYEQPPITKVNFTNGQPIVDLDVSYVNHDYTPTIADLVVKKAAEETAPYNKRIKDLQTSIKSWVGRRTKIDNKLYDTNYNYDFNPALIIPVGIGGIIGFTAHDEHKRQNPKHLEHLKKELNLSDSDIIDLLIKYSNECEINGKYGRRPMEPYDVWLTSQLWRMKEQRQREAKEKKKLERRHQETPSEKYGGTITRSQLGSKSFPEFSDQIKALGEHPVTFNRQGGKLHKRQCV